MSENAIGATSKSGSNGLQDIGSNPVDNSPPKSPSLHRSLDAKRKQVVFWEDSTVNSTSIEVKNPSPKQTLSCESDSEQNLPRKYPQISSSSQTTESQPSEPFSRSSKSSQPELEVDILVRSRKFPGIHRSSQQRVASWNTEVMNELELALNDMKFEVGKNLKGRDFESERVIPEKFPNMQSSNLGYKWDTERYRRFSKNFESDGIYSKDLMPASQNPFLKPHQIDNNKMIPREYRRALDEDDVRKIVNGILNEFRPGRPERSISCSSSCSGCCSSCCCSNVSNFGCCSRPSTPAVDIPKIRRKPNFLVSVHGSPSIKSYRSTCSCSQCSRYQYPSNPSSIASSTTWTTTQFCPKCLPPNDKDSLDSEISLDSLNQQSIYSLDSLNSLTDPDSLEYAKTDISIDSLDSLDSCCNYDSLSDSKDSGFFSCSLPPVC